MLQGDHWIEARRTMCGNKTREGCHAQKNERGEGNGRDVVGPNVVKERAHRARGDDRQDQTNRETGERQSQAASAEREEDVP